MSLDSITAKTGETTIKKLGQTKNSVFGLDSRAQTRNPKQATDESPK